jgi:hypothetical protein
MNRIYLNGNEITNFDNDQDTVDFVEKLISGKTEFIYNDDEDSVSFELEGQGLIDVDLSDLNEDGKLTIFE